MDKAQGLERFEGLRNLSLRGAGARGHKARAVSRDDERVAESPYRALQCATSAIPPFRV